jgi:hypothetical protein
MKTETITVLTFDELSDDGKERAIADYRHAGHGYFGIDDGITSLKEFCKHFNVSIKDYSLGTCSHSYVDTDAKNIHFRHIKLHEFSPEYMPTGFCSDVTLWGTFYKDFKATGCALQAFNYAIDAWVRDIVADMEYQESDEAIAEMLSINNYEFLESGERW